MATAPPGIKQRVEILEDRVDTIEETLSTTTTAPPTTTTTVPPTTTTTFPSTRHVVVTQAIHRGSGDFSDIPDQPYYQLCKVGGNSGGRTVWEKTGTTNYGTVLELEFDVPYTEQFWCGLFIQPHNHWERATDVQRIVNGHEYIGSTSSECLMPAPGGDYMITNEGLEFLPGRSEGCDVAFTVVH